MIEDSVLTKTLEGLSREALEDLAYAMFRASELLGESINLVEVGSDEVIAEVVDSTKLQHAYLEASAPFYVISEKARGVKEMGLHI